MNRHEGIRRERLYAVGILLMAVMMFGTVGALECDTITISQGCWQIVWSLIGGLVFWNGIRLEETRMCRRGRKH